MESKKCIVHFPNKIDVKESVGSQVRPNKIMEAFKNNGYEIECIMGYGKERKKSIKRIKESIKRGTQYDFLYSENSTMPTLLTEKNHLPFYPTLDFGFMKFCKRRGMKIGLFYRDVYWKFPIYKKKVSILKRMITIPMYKYDLYKYKKLLDKLYLPSERMGKYVDIPVDSGGLPPGSVANEWLLQKKKELWKIKKEEIELFYVGGIGDLYDLTKLLKVVSKLPYISLTICCRKEDWTSMKDYYAPYMSEGVQVIHKSGKELQGHYLKADLCMLFFESEEYRSFAMPIKLFEYLGNLTPIIATTNTAAGDFVSKNDIGWSIPHEEETLESLLREIHKNREILREKNDKMKSVLLANTWEARAKAVIKDLIPRREHI